MRSHLSTTLHGQPKNPTAPIQVNAPPPIHVHVTKALEINLLESAVGQTSIDLVCSVHNPPFVLIQGSLCGLEDAFVAVEFCYHGWRFQSSCNDLKGLNTSPFIYFPFLEPVQTFSVFISQCLCFLDSENMLL